MKYQMLHTLLKHAEANVQLHKMNIRTYLVNPAGIGEHSDITDAIQVEIDKISRYHDQIEVINTYLRDKKHPIQLDE